MTLARKKMTPRLVWMVVWFITLAAITYAFIRGKDGLAGFLCLLVPYLLVRDWIGAKLVGLTRPKQNESVKK
jgi:hypothetical protein